MSDFVRTLETLELVGGALCLDLVNTVNSRRDTEHDYLITYADLTEWAKKTGVLSTTHSSQLNRRAGQHMEEADKALQKALRLRDLLYRLFSSAARDSEPSNDDMALLVQYYGDSVSRGQFIKRGASYGTTWKVDETLDALLSPIIHSAGELLQSSELSQVKECPGCGWLFLDTSKNQSRRWCSMNTCGARDKMRRYHKRKRAK